MPLRRRNLRSRRVEGTWRSVEECGNRVEEHGNHTKERGKPVEERGGAWAVRVNGWNLLVAAITCNWPKLLQNDENMHVSLKSTEINRNHPKMQELSRKSWESSFTHVFRSIRH